MKMDRNITDDGLGKYAVINLRKLNETCGNAGTFQRWTPEVQAALDTLESVGVLEWGRTGQSDEFFLIKLKDRFAAPALLAYAEAIDGDDSEFAGEVRDMAMRSGTHNPHCKMPD